MRKYILLFLLTILVLPIEGRAALPWTSNGRETYIDYSYWNWEDLSRDNWEYYQNKQWTDIPPAFATTTNAINLMATIQKEKDYTYDLGWRLVMAEFEGECPHFMLYNVYSSLLRAFIYSGSNAEATNFTSMGFSLTPSVSVDDLKIFATQPLLLAVNDKSEKTVETYSVFTSGAKYQWIAFEIPLMMDQRIVNKDVSWEYAFYYCDKFDLKFEINGIASGLDASGNNLLKHKEPIVPGKKFAGNVATVSKSVKNVKDIASKIKDNAEKIEKNDALKSISFLHKFAKETKAFAEVASLAGKIVGIATGVDAALGVVNSLFGFGGGASSAPAVCGF